MTCRINERGGGGGEGGEGRVTGLGNAGQDGQAIKGDEPSVGQPFGTTDVLFQTCAHNVNPDGCFVPIIARSR